MDAFTLHIALVILTWENFPERMILFMFWSVLPFFVGMWLVEQIKQTRNVFGPQVRFTRQRRP